MVEKRTELMKNERKTLKTENSSLDLDFKNLNKRTRVILQRSYHL
jgi:hypothetical protein